MKQVFYLAFLLLSCFGCQSQTYLFECESKLVKQTQPDKWESELKYKDFKFKWCAIDPNNKKCFEESTYSLFLKRDTVFIVNEDSSNFKIKSHAQFSLNKKDTTIFLTESSDGFKNGSTEGRVSFIKDTMIIAGKKNYDCYLFRRNEESRGERSTETICLDKKTLIPIYSRTVYFDAKNQPKPAYKMRRLCKIKK